MSAPSWHGCSSEELQHRLVEVAETLRELRASYMALRAGGCALEALIEQAEAEQEQIQEELRRRGEPVTPRMEG